MRLFHTSYEKSNVALGKWTAVHSLALLYLSVLVTSVPQEKQIKNGERITIQTMPHSVLILVTNQWPSNMSYCSGTLLDTSWVLAAAHCFDQFFKRSRKDGLIKILFGIDTLTQEGLVKDVKRIVFHEDYASEVYDDLCLLQTFDEISYNDRMQPALMSRNIDNVQSATYVRVAGWGVTEKLTWPWYLSAVDLPMISVTECNERLKSENLSEVKPGTFFCAGKKIFKPKSVCIGYSDSAAALWMDSMWVALGIAAGSICDGPSLFMSVSHYAPWILDIVVKYSG